jgi:hypothetical protein
MVSSWFVMTCELVVRAQGVTTLKLTMDVTTGMTT